jgi:tetratricopeptide (TPR) repeat protein
VNLGGALLARNQYEEALPVIRKAHALRPEDALANALLGLSYFRLGDDEQAIEHLTSAKQSDPANFTYPQLALARIYSRQDDPYRAASELREFLACHPDSEESPNVQRWLALLQESGGAAVTVVAEALDPAPIPCDW